MYVNKKNFDKEREMEKKALEAIEKITEIKSIPLGTEAGRRTDRLEKVFNMFKHFIKDMNIKGQSIKVNADDKQKVDKIIAMARDILNYIETGKMEKL